MHERHRNSEICPKETIDSLQAGRGIAALSVVLLHSALAAQAFGAAFDGLPLLGYGYLGVDYFFVLSGFIIYHSTVGRGRGIGYYALARVRRIYLPYLPVGVGIAILYVTLPGLREGSSGWNWIPTLTLAPVDSAPALSVAWTLQHEVLFYFLFGLFYFSGTLPIGMTAWAVCILLVGTHLAFASINLEFFFGIAAAMLYRAKRASPFLCIVAPVSILIWILYGADVDHRVWIGLAFASIVAPLAQLESRGLSVPRSLVWLGGASYSLYLIHNPIVSVIGRVFRGSWAILPMGVIASLVGASVYHVLVEKRVIAKRAKPEVFAGKVPRTAAALSAPESCDRERKS